MATILNSSLTFDSTDQIAEVVLTLDTLPSSSVYKIDLRDVSGNQWAPNTSWVEDTVNKTITFSVSVWQPIEEIESFKFELPYEPSGQSLIAVLDNAGSVVSSTASPMFVLDFGLAPFNGSYTIASPSVVFFTDGTSTNFSYHDFLCVFYASDILNTFIADKVPVRFEITQGLNVLIFELEAGSTSRFSITEIKEPTRLNLQLLQATDFEDPNETFYPKVDFIDIDGTGSEFVSTTKWLGLYGSVGEGLVEKISLTEYNFLYRLDQVLPVFLKFFFKNNETLKFSKNEDSTYTLVSHEAPTAPEDPEDPTDPTDPGGVWTEKPLTGGDLIQTTSNSIYAKGSAIITIRSSVPMSPDFKYWRIPFSGLANEIDYRTPTKVELSADGKKAVLTITPGPKGKFFIENGDFTKEYEVISLSEANTEIQFSNNRVQVYANDSKYAFEDDSVILRLYKIVGGITETIPTAVFTGARNAFYYLAPDGTTAQFGSTNYDFSLFGVYKDKVFNKAEYKFVFEYLAFLKPYAINNGFDDILTYDPSGSTDGFYTGDKFYEAANS